MLSRITAFVHALAESIRAPMFHAIATILGFCGRAGIHLYGSVLCSLGTKKLGILFARHFDL